MNRTEETDLMKKRVAIALDILSQFGSPDKAKMALECSYESIKAYRKRGFPEKVALLCHLSPDIPYTYNPADYGRNPDNLGLALSKPTK